MTKSVAGYKNSTFRKVIILIVNCFINLFFLKKNTEYSNEFSTILNSYSKKKITFDGKEIFFKTGHNRLNSRVERFFIDEPLLIEWIRNFSSDDIFLDIGANVGTYSVAALSKGSFVYSIEMDLNNSAVLFENIFLNKFYNKSVILPFGVGSKDNLESIFYRDFTVGDCLQSIGREAQIPTIKKNPFQIKQPIFSLDNLFKNLSLKQPTKIKIDVDGNEKFVLEGGKKVILNSNEIYYEDIGSNEDKEIIDTILNNNFYISSEMLATNQLAGRVDRNILFKKRGSS
jgi:FkbM family methyltransferase